MATETLGAIGVSAAGSAPPLQTLRKYDRSDKILMRGLAQAPVLTSIIGKNRKRAVGDIKYYMTEEDYLIQNGTLQGDNGSGTAAAITTSTAYFKIIGPSSELGSTFIRPGDMIHLPAVQTTQSAAEGTVYPQGEDVIVEEWVQPSVARVTRGGGNGTRAGNVTASSGNSLNFEMKGIVVADDSSSPLPRANTLEEDYNYREIRREPWAVTARAMMQDNYGMPEEQRLAIAHRTNLLRYMERSFFTNIRYLGYDANGSERSHTGGFFEFIADTSATWARNTAYTSTYDLVTGDGTQRIWTVNKNFSLDNWSKFMEKATRYGNATGKIGVGGRGFLIELENLLRPYYGGFDWSVNEFGFGVVKANGSFGSNPIMVENEFSLGANGYDYNFCLLDMEYMGYVYGQGPCAIKGCGNQNSDLHVHTEIQANDAASRKDELFVDFGWDQRFRKAHAWLRWDGSK